MGDVVQFKKVDEDDPHIAGHAKCPKCSREWAAVAPVGTVKVECPWCSSDAYMRYETVTEHAQWECFCGSEYFRLDVVGPYCCVCGLRHDNGD